MAPMLKSGTWGAPRRHQGRGKGEMYGVSACPYQRRFSGDIPALELISAPQTGASVLERWWG